MLNIEALPDATAARADIEAWGYPRPLAEGELEASPALRVHDEGLTVGWIWYLVFEAADGYEVSPHLIVSPAYRGRACDRYILHAIHRFGRLLGARRMIAMPAEGTNIVRLIERLGWNYDGGRWVYEYGD